MRFLLLSLIAVVSTASPLYTVREFGLANSLTVSAVSISGTGAVVGEAHAPDQTRIAVVGAGALAVEAVASDVNSEGIVTGTTWAAAGPRATVWENGASRLLDIWNSYGNGINERGAVAGSGSNAGRTSAFLYAGGATTFIDAGTWSAAYDVSNNGHVAGYAEQQNGSFRAFSWTAAGGLQYIGTLGGRHSYAQAVNDHGVVVGASTNRAGYLNAFAYNGRMIALGTLGGTTSAAYDVNGNGHVVGYSTDAAGRSRAFVWRDGILFDLNAALGRDSGWTLDAAYSINNAGQIVGSGTKGGRSTGFILDPHVLATALLEPVQSSTVLQNDSFAPIPEPRTGTAFALGLLLIGGIRAIRTKAR